MPVCMIAVLAILWIASCCLGEGDSPPAPLAPRTEKLTVGDITISYPPGLEAQAQEAAKLAAEVIAPRREKLRNFKQKINDSDGIAAQICKLIGCPEHVENARETLNRMDAGIDICAMLADIRLYTESELKASGGIKEGPVRLTYDPKEDAFSFEFGMSVNINNQPDGGNKDAAPKTFFPLIIKNDGTFRTKDKHSIAQDTMSFCDVMEGSSMTSIHEAAEVVLADKLKLYHPFSRWFNDGVANWVMLKIGTEVAPDMENHLRYIAFPGEQEKPLKAKVNLLTWPQLKYLNRAAFTPIPDDIKAANYCFATEAVDRLLQDQPPDTLAKIIGKLKDKPMADTDVICVVIKDVTGKDFKAILLEYTPEHVRTGLKEGASKALLAEAKAKMDKGNYAEAVKLLTRLLEMTPFQVEARLDLAQAMRISGAPKAESEFQIILAAALTISSGININLSFTNAEGAYVSARLLQLIGQLFDQRSPEQESMARKIYEKILEASPDHADALAALAELDKIESPQNTEPKPGD